MKNACLPLRDLLLQGSGRRVHWKKIFLALFQRNLKPDAVKTLLLLMAKKGEGVQEILGCLEALHQIDPPRRVNLPFLIDVCGTGGDGKKTFNISTMASFILAGAGAYVVKHGNRSVSSRVGSSDLMEALGIRLDFSFSEWLGILQKCRLAYFHAPLFHPSFAVVQGVRRELGVLGVRTLFNLLGPLVNPVQLDYQIVGVPHRAWLSPLAKALKWLGRKKAAVFSSRDGLDELSTREVNDILCLAGGRIRAMQLDPQKLGFSKVRLEDYCGGELETNRTLALQLLRGQLRGPLQDIVVLNSGFALWIAGIAPSVEGGIKKSREVIQRGEAWKVLEDLRRLTTRRNSDDLKRHPHL